MQLPGSTDKLSSPTLQDGVTPLMNAAKYGHTATVDALLSHKAGVDLQEKVSKLFCV